MKWFMLRLCLSPDGDQGGDAGDQGDAGQGGQDGAVAIRADHGDQSPPVEYKAPELDMKGAIPPEYRDKPYFQKLESFEQMVKEFDGLQGLLGKPRAAVPGENATPEELESFFSGLRPKEATEYEFPETEFSKAQGRDEAYTTEMAKAFHKVGIHKHQAAELVQMNDAVLAQMAERQKEAAVQRDQEFDTRLKDTFKENTNAVLARNKEIIQKHVPEDLRESLMNLPNDALLAVTTMLDDIHKKYIAPDNFNPQGGSAAGPDAATLSAEGRKIMASEAYKDFRNPGHEEAKQRVSDLYKQIAGLK